MRLKKGLIGVFALGALLAFAGCGSNNDETTEATTETTTEAVTEDTTEVMTEAATEETTGEDTADGDAGHTEEMTLIHNAVKDAYGESYIPNMEYDSETARELFGLEPEWYDDMIAEGPMISVHVDTFIAVHPTEGNLENVENALTEYRDYLVSNSIQYPSNQVKVEAARVETIGDYVFFLMLGNIDLEIEDEEEMLAAYQEQNQIAVDAITEALGL